MPEKGGTDERPAKRVKVVRYRRPAAELVQRAARRVVRGGKASFSSQAEFRKALLYQLRRDEPLAVLGGPRLRRLLIDVPGVRMSVRFTERTTSRPLVACPVCASPLAPIHNRTLTGDTVVLGQRCTRCEYWTHATRRVPVRYLFSEAGIDGRPKRFAEPRSSARTAD
ncbi:MAG TPA: hypothetical protein VMH38_01190 [Thermoplasmata archaeon]|nr:hypothetical protein [Thermoplasmata archaeon]